LREQRQRARAQGRDHDPTGQRTIAVARSGSQRKRPLDRGRNLRARRRTRPARDRLADSQPRQSCARGTGGHAGRAARAGL